MGKRFIPRGRAPNGGHKRTAKAEFDINVCIGAVVHVDGMGKGVLYHLARRTVSYPTIPTSVKTTTTFAMTAGDIAYSALNAQSHPAGKAASERQWEQWDIGFQRLTGRPLPRVAEELQREAWTLGSGSRRF